MLLVALLVVLPVLAVIATANNLLEPFTGRLVSEEEVSQARDEGYRAGREDGYEAGRADGYDDGLSDGKDEGFVEGCLYDEDMYHGFEPSMSRRPGAGRYRSSERASVSSSVAMRSGPMVRLHSKGPPG